ncbi:MAG: hypothetical protein HYU32_06700 [candidate division NC10 bacterium]|nr:hypothetical protein [candidate division NC10 bacterium]MBI2458294.1 hypothetical protein [candidate division NC10 bacterium]
MDKKTESIFYALNEEVAQLFYRWKIFEQLFSSEGNLRLLNTSGSNVFYLLHVLILDNVFLTLCRLTDPAQQGSNENASIPNLVARIDGVIDAATRQSLRARLAELEKVCENMRDHRRKRIAHIDVNCALRAGTEWLMRPTWGEVEDGLSLVREVMQAIGLALFNRSSVDDDPLISAGCDGDTLLHVLRKAHGTEEAGQRVAAPEGGH